MAGNCSRSETAKNSGSICVSELDRSFLTDTSLFALSNDGTLTAPKSIVVEYTTSSLFAPCSHPSTVSPNPISKMSVLSPTIPLHAAFMNSVLEGKSSTPYERMAFRKPVLASLLNLSSVDLTTSHPLWEVSLIRPNMESPKVCLDSSKMEFTWSPSYQASPQMPAKNFSPTWSGTLPEGQRSCQEFTFQDSNLRHATLELTEEQQKSLSRNMAM